MNRVIVVGAGISGLRVADLLTAAHIDVLLLESRQRTGGRLHTVSGPTGPVDLGATWFWPHEGRVLSLIDELGLPIHNQHLAGDAVYQDAQRTRRLDGNPIDVPAGRFSLGAQDLAHRLAQRLAPGCLATDRPVLAVSARTDGLRVETGAGALEAEHVVLALPPALAVSRIRFDPALPATLVDLARRTPTWMGSMAKVVAVFDSAFWRDHGLSGAAISHVGPMRELHDMSGPAGRPAALFGFAPLPTADSVAPEPDAIVRQLSALFGPSTPEPVELYIADWRSEPDTSPPDTGVAGDYRTYGHPAWRTAALDGRLHWSATETSSTSPGHIEGALERAETVAARIIDDLNRRNAA